MENKTCHLTGKDLEPSEVYSGSSIRPNIFQLIQKDFPDFTEDSLISISELNKYRKQYIEKIIQQELGEISSLENDVVKSITEHEILSDNIDESIETQFTFGQRLADKVASFGGSWSFILFFFGFILVWIMINIVAIFNNHFDPYPFILLNLILSCVASIQAPIIMMSQNRREEKDRLRNEHDYKVNLKAELEIRLLHEKIDHLIIHQNQRLAEIQELQSDYMEDILDRLTSTKK